MIIDISLKVLDKIVRYQPTDFKMMLIDRLFHLLGHSDEIIMLNAIKHIIYFDGHNYFNNPNYMEKIMFLCQSPDFFVN